MRKILEWRPQTGVVFFVLCIAFANLVLYQKPLLDHAISVSALPEMEGWLQLVSLHILQFCLLSSFLLLISAVSILLLKVVSAVLAITNAAALYFMLTYAMELDLAMIGNILNTDTGEASGLFHISIIPFVFALGVLPALLIFWTKVHKSGRLRRVLYSIVIFAALLGFLLATATTWLWYDKNATRLGSKILPWSYVVNTGRYFNRIALDDREQVLLPPARFETEAPARKQVVVLVIGEAARAENFSLYGYGKETNPFTKDTGIVAFPIGRSCSTYTIASTACILTHEGSQASSYTKFEPLPNYLMRHGVETIFRKNNTGIPPIEVNSFEPAREIAQACGVDKECPNPKLDEALNWNLEDILNTSTSQRIFVTLHQSGSHGPAYHTQYPEDFAHFQPECETVQLAKCTEEELGNSYDNTIRYTDFLLADLIKQLQKVDAETAMIYVSDHGESLGEGGLYLHGAPNAVAPKQQREIPFLVWMSESFQQSRGLKAEAIVRAETLPHDFPFHSVMGAFGMRSDIYKPENDIFSVQN